MAGKNKIKLQFDGLEEYAERLDRLGGDIAEATEKALIKSQQHIANNINKFAIDSKYPAKGKYASGDTKRSIISDGRVVWVGTTAEIKIGFDFKVSGLDTIFLMYGTPKMKPVAGLKNAIYGAKTKKEIRQIQNDVFNEEIKKRMEG